MITPKEAQAELAKRKLASLHLEDFIKYTFSQFEIEDFHKELFNALERIERGELKRLIVQMPPRAGKALEINTLIPTPNGWKKIIELEVGDSVFDENGKITMVVAKSDVWKNRKVYNVITNTGHKIIADENHEWLVRLCRKRKVFKKRETKYLFNRKCDRSPLIKHHGGLCLPEIKLPIDPYVLGLWLGDGSSYYSAITIGKEDQEFLRTEIEKRGIITTNYSSDTQFGLIGMHKQLKDLNLYENKHIPDIYLRSSLEQRLSLLQGLIDSDGHINKNGRVEFCNTNKTLSKQVQELVISLGVKCSLSEGIATLYGKNCGKKYRVAFYMKNCSKLPRKNKNSKNGTKQPGHYITVEDAGFADTVCIEVESRSHMFLAGEAMLPTCNSEVISKRFPAYILGKYPEKEIVCASYSGDLASEFGRKTRDLVLDEEFKRVFPKFELSDSKKEGGNWETKEGGKYLSVGVSGSLTGKGFDIGIIDDPVKDREEAESLTMRERVWNWYTSTFFTRKKGSDAAIIILMTRWNTDDLVGRIIEVEGEKWEILSFPAINENGEALCKRKGFGLSFYEDQRSAIGMRDFSALYQQDPIASSGVVFKKEDFRYFAMSDLKKENFTFAIHVDPAFSTKKTSDGTAIMVSARHKETGELYILDAFSEPVLPSEAYSYIISLAGKWKKSGWTMNFLSVEDVSLSASQKEFVSGLEEEMRRQRAFYTVHHFKPVGQGKKEDRIKFQLEPMFNRHAIYFRSDESGNQTWYKLEDQLLKFPASRKDDLADVLAQCVYMWEKRGGNYQGSAQAARAYLNKIRNSR
jgi:hypothetical protein